MLLQQIATDMLSEQIRVYNDHEITSTQAEWKISLYKISRHSKLPTIIGQPLKPFKSLRR